MTQLAERPGAVAVEDTWEPRCGLCWQLVPMYRGRVRLVTTAKWCIVLHTECWQRLRAMHICDLHAEAHVRAICGAGAP